MTVRAPAPPSRVLGGLRTRATRCSRRGAATVSFVAAISLAASGVVASSAAANTGGAVAASDSASDTQADLAAGRAGKPVAVPGNFTGLGFDTCEAPSQATMDELRTESPYWGVGIYIGGEERTCPQPNLDADWVKQQVAQGWHVFALWVGPQSQCSDADFVTDISAENPRATRQGVRAANRAIDAAQQLGIKKGSTLFVDVEGYDNTTSACNQPVLSYQSGWNKQLRKLGWKAGFYSAVSSGIASLDFIRATQPGAYTMPDAVWVSHANGKPTTDAEPWLRDSFWAGQRIHQYTIDINRSFGTASLTIDENAIDIGTGSRPGAVRSDCGGVQLTFSTYLRLMSGDKNAQVTAAQCLLKQRGLYKPKLSTKYTAATVRGVTKFQRKHDLQPTGDVGPATWTALLSGGGTPLVKRGSASDRVRALQRALAAATGKKVDVSGIFTAATTTAVRTYQRNVGLERNGIVGRGTWRSLQSGTIR